MEGENEHFEAKATGFFANRGGFAYLVTARHVAMRIGDAPFQMRVNLKDGSSTLVTFDPDMDPIDRWHLHEDPDVDVAAILFPFVLQGGLMDQLALDETLLLTDAQVVEEGIGIGDRCYAVGLFRLMQGKKRNFPMVHSGAIAAIPDDEKIPMRDGADVRHVQGYVVEMTNLNGLSGSPVFVRSTVNAVVQRVKIHQAPEGIRIEKGAHVAISAPNNDLRLLGVWAGSWEAEPSEVLALSRGREVRVPVGFGTVIPTQRLLEILDSVSAVKQREDQRGKYKEITAAVMDSSPSSGAA